MRKNRRNQLVWAILVGIGAGTVAVAFQEALHVAESLRGRLVAMLTAQGSGIALSAGLFAVLCVLVTAWGTRRFCPEAAGSGIPHLKGVLIGVRTMHGIWLIVVKFIGGLLAIGAGLSLGREGPTVQMGGAVGQLFASGSASKTPQSGSLLIAVGAGAGLSAAFNAPLAGFLFVMEELHFEFAPMPYISALAASITADMISRMAAGQLPAFLVFSHSTPPLSALPGFAILGVLSGLLALLFKKSLIGGLRWTNHLSPKAAWFVPVAAGMLAWLAVLYLPEVAGGGHETSENMLNGSILHRGPGLIFLLLAGKFFLTLISYLAKVPGGIFAPMLVIGGLLGLGVGYVHCLILPGLQGVTPEVFAVIGMASFFAGVVHAPLTGLALIIEMTANFKLLFPMMVATLLAFIMSEWWGGEPVYESLLNEDLRRSGPPPVLFQEPLSMHVQVEEESEMVDRRINQIGFPEGVLIVSVNRRGQKFVPSGLTELKEGDALELMISGEVSTCTQEIRDLAHARLKPAGKATS
ncbi:MAG TPA: H(+)/Cl(-) exchange transporter ClcA [Candidatus Ozemobacteraceae bacterium]|nr:H(+)/Cl(-) exchange transporter ClcA [Candidatus Ozemobacteraceae bacterium]